MTTAALPIAARAAPRARAVLASGRLGRGSDSFRSSSSPYCSLSSRPATWSSAASRTSRAADIAELRQSVHPGEPLEAYKQQPRDQPGHGGHRRDFRLPPRLRRHRRPTATDPPQRHGDVLRRGLELRRRAARPRLHLHPRPRRARHRCSSRVIGIDIYADGFTLYSKIGLVIVYLYFQFPLMVLIIAPAIDGMKTRVAGGVGEHGRQLGPVLAAHRPADADADDPRHDDPALR